MNSTTPRVVGQQVFVVYSGSFSHSSKLHTVVKVTPSGQITVRPFGAESDASDKRFTPNGREVGSSYGRHHLDWNVEARSAFNAQQKLRVAAATALRLVTQDAPSRIEPTWGTDAMRAEIERLEALVKTARAAVDALPAN